MKRHAVYLINHTFFVEYHEPGQHWRPPERLPVLNTRGMVKQHNKSTDPVPRQLRQTEHMSDNW